MMLFLEYFNNSCVFFEKFVTQTKSLKHFYFEKLMDFEIVTIPWYIKLANHFHERVIIPIRTPTGTPYYERTCK